MKGYLFFSCNKYEGAREARLVAFALDELSRHRKDVVNLADLNPSYAILRTPESVYRLHGVLGLSLYHLPSRSTFSNIIRILVMVAAEVHPENALSRIVPIIGYTYTFNFRDLTEQETSRFTYVHNTIPAACGAVAFKTLQMWVEGIGRRSGKLIILAADKAPSIIGPIRPDTLYPWRDCLLLGVDEEEGEIFYAPMSTKPCAGHSKVYIDDYGSGLVRLVARDGATYIDVHYVPE